MRTILRAHSTRETIWKNPQTWRKWTAENPSKIIFLNVQAMSGVKLKGSWDYIS